MTAAGRLPRLRQSELGAKGLRAGLGPDQGGDKYGRGDPGTARETG